MPDRLQIAKIIGMDDQITLDKIIEYDNDQNSYAVVDFQFPTFVAAAGDIFYFSFNSTFSKLFFEYERPGIVDSVSTWEYWNGSWTGLTVTDDTGGFVRDESVSWTTPGDWVMEDMDTLFSITIDDVDRYWLRVILQDWPDPNLKIFSVKREDIPNYQKNGFTPFEFSINPRNAVLHPAKEQTAHKLIGGEVFVQKAEGDAENRFLSWQDLSEDVYEDFIFGKLKNKEGKFESVYFYAPNSGTMREMLKIVDQTLQSYTKGTLNIPFINNEEALFYSDAAMGVDRLFFGANEKFYGLSFEFDELINKSFTDLLDINGVQIIESITLRFPDSSGDLSANSITYSSDENTSDDGTERFKHNGQMNWNAISSWASVSMNTILTGSGLDNPQGFSDNRSFYYCELTVSYVSESWASIKIQDVRSRLDSLKYLGMKYSDGTLPIWFLHIPDSLKVHRPETHQDDEWIPIKILDVVTTLSSPTQLWWNVELTFVIAGPREISQPIALDKNTPFDSLSHTLS